MLPTLRFLPKPTNVYSSFSHVAVPNLAISLLLPARSNKKILYRKLDSRWLLCHTLVVVPGWVAVGVNGGPWGLCGRVFGALGGGLASLLAGSLGALRWGFWGPFWGLRWCFWTKKKNRGSGHIDEKKKTGFRAYRLFGPSKCLKTQGL